MADTNSIYVKVGIETKDFDNTLKGLRKEMIALKGIMGSSILSKEENDALKQRFGDVVDTFKELQQEAQATNVAIDETFGNMARFAGVASSAVGGVIAGMSLLGIESEKVGQVEKSILQFMAVGNALQAVADNKRLLTLAQIYGQKLKDLFITKEINAAEAVGGGGTTGGEPTGTSDIAKANTAANVAQAASTTQVTTAIQANTAAVSVNITELMLQNSEFIKQQQILGALEAEWSVLTGEENFNTEATALNTANQSRLSVLNDRIIMQKQTLIGLTRREIANNTVDTSTTNANTVATGENTVATSANAVATNVSNASLAKAAFAQGSYITGVKLAVLATWDFTKALLANPLVWFALALAAVVAAIYGLVKAWNYFLDREGAIKEINETIKTTIELNKEWAKQNEELAQSIADVDDKLLVQSGKITENQAKKNALYRKYWDELKTEQDKKLKEMSDLQRKWNEGEIKTEILYLTLRKSIQDNFDMNNAKRWELLQKELQVIENDGAASLLEKQKEAYNKRIELEKQTHDKLVAIWKETWDDQYNRLVLHMIGTENTEKTLIENQNIVDKTKELWTKYFTDLKSIQSSNKIGDITFADYQKALDIQKKYNEDSKALVIEDGQQRIQQVNRDNDLVQLTNTNNFNKELQVLDDKIKANLELKKDASKEDLEQITKNDKILNKTREVLIEDFINTQQSLTVKAGIDIQKIQTETDNKLYEIDKTYLENRINLWNSKINLQRNIVDTLTKSEELPSKTWQQVKKDRAEEISILQQLKTSYQERYDAEVKQIQLTKTGQEAVIAEAQAYDELTNSINETDVAIYNIQTKKPGTNFMAGWTPEALGRDFKDNWVNYMTEIANKTGEIMTSTIDAFIQQSQYAMEMMLEQMDQAVTQEKDNLSTLLDEQLLTRKQYDDKVAEIDRKKAETEKKLKRDQFQKEKQANILKAIISGALAVVQAYASAGNPILGAVFAALTAAVVATQIGLIAKQPVPQFAEGGKVEGKPHSEGGVPIVAEGGEFVVRKSIVQQPGMLEKLVVLNSRGLVPMFANGGLVTNNRSMSTSTSYNTYNQTSDETIRTIVGEVISGMSSIPVVNVESDYSKVQRKVQSIETRSSW